MLYMLNLAKFIEFRYKWPFSPRLQTPFPKISQQGCSNSKCNYNSSNPPPSRWCNSWTTSTARPSSTTSTETPESCSTSKEN